MSEKPKREGPNLQVRMDPELREWLSKYSRETERTLTVSLERILRWAREEYEKSKK